MTRWDAVRGVVRLRNTKRRMARYIIGPNDELTSFDDTNCAVEQHIQRLHSSMPAGGAVPRWPSDSLIRSGSVPTELLSGGSSGSHEGLNLPSEATQPGCFLHLLCDRPRLVICCIYLVVAILVGCQIAFGEFNISVDDKAFQDNDDIIVSQAAVADELYYNTAWMKADEYGWRSTSSRWTQYHAWNSYSQSGRRLGHDPEVSASCGFTATTEFRLVYKATGGGSVLTPRALQRIYYIESRLMQALRDNGLCATVQHTYEAQEDLPPLYSSCDTCVPFGSVLGYFFPAMHVWPCTSAPASNASLRGVAYADDQRVLRFGGTSGGYGVNDAHAGLRCGPAILDSEVQSVLAWLDARNQTGWFDQSSSFASELRPQAHQQPAGRHRYSATYLESRLRVSLKAWKAGLDDGRSLEVMEVFDEIRHNGDVEVYTDIVDRYWTLPERLLQRHFMHDAALLGVAVGLILLYMIYSFGNVCFALSAVLQIVLSMPVMFFVVDVVLRQRPVSAFACTSIWVVTGVSTDNIFVVHETWNAAKLLRVNGEMAPRARRMRWTLAQSARPLLIADGTTAFSLFINCVSPIDGVFQFGLCGGLLIMINFVLVLCYMPALLSLEEQGRFRRCQCCQPSEEAELHRLRRLHSIHGTLYTWRRLIVLVGVVAVGFLLPAAIRLLNVREGHSFELLEGLTVPNDARFLKTRRADWQEPDDTFLSEAMLAAQDGGMPSPNHYERLLGGALMRQPDVSLSLWPSAAGLSVVVLLLDAVLLLAVARVCWKGRTIGVLRLPGPLQRGSKQARRMWAWGFGLVALLVLGVAIWAIVVSVMDPMEAATIYGCDYADVISNALAALLIVHALALACFAVIYTSDRLTLWYRGFLLQQAPARRRRMVTAMCLGVAAGPCLFSLWWLWSVLLMWAAVYMSYAKPFGHLRGPRSGAIRHGFAIAMRLSAYGLLLQLMAWTVFVLMGFQHSSPSHTVYGIVLASCLALHSVAHCCIAYVINIEPLYSGTGGAPAGASNHVTPTAAPPHTAAVTVVGAEPRGALAAFLLRHLRSTEWAGRHPECSTYVHLGCAALWLVPALLTLSSSIDSTVRFSGTALGLGALLVVDSGLCWLIAHVIGSGRPVGLLRPLGGHSLTDGDTCTNIGFFAASTLAAAAALGGWACLIISSSHHLYETVFGAHGAAIVLAIVLFVHTPFGLLCAFVLASGRAVGIFQPPQRRPSPRAAPETLGRVSRLLAALLLLLVSAACVGGGIVLLRDNVAAGFFGGRGGGGGAGAGAGGGGDSTVSAPSGADVRDYPLISPLALVTAVLLTFDAAVFFFLSWRYAYINRFFTRLLFLACAPCDGGDDDFDESYAPRELTTCTIEANVAVLTFLATAFVGGAVFLYNVAFSSVLAADVGALALRLAFEALTGVHAGVCVLIALPRPLGLVFNIRLLFVLVAMGFAGSSVVPAALRDELFEAVGAGMVSLCLLLWPFLDHVYVLAYSQSRVRRSSTSTVRVLTAGNRDRYAWKRRLLGVLVSGLAAAAAICYVRVALGAALQPSVVTQLIGCLLLIHAVPLACLADTWFVGRPFAGFEPKDAPRGTWRKRGARIFALLAIGCVAAGSGLAYAGSSPSGSVSLVAGSSDAEVDLGSESAWRSAELCTFVWGVGNRLHTDGSGGPDDVPLTSGMHRTSVSRLADFQVAAQATQRDLDAACDALVLPASPLHSQHKQVKQYKPLCTMQEIRDHPWPRRWPLGRHHPWPLAPETFTEQLIERMQSGSSGARIGTTVGLSGAVGPNASAIEPEQLAWLMVLFRSKYNMGDGTMFSSPATLKAYIDEYQSFFAQLPQLSNISDSVVSQGFITCPSWRFYPTITAFLSSVMRSIIFTPLFCLVAVFFTVRDVLICYASLLSVASMIVVTMGTMQLLGIPLGPIESIALAVIIGVSIDYLIHLAFAYQNSVMTTRYYKSRAALLARSKSIVAAALTTLCSVLPLLGSKLAPLRQFGVIFTLVTVISFVFSYGFFDALMMIAGPLKTRGELSAVDDVDDANIQTAQRRVADEAAAEMIEEEMSKNHEAGAPRRMQVVVAPAPVGGVEMAEAPGLTRQTQVTHTSSCAAPAALEAAPHA